MVEPWDAIRWIAMFRLGLPGVILRYAGGREVTLRDLQAMGLTSGINALIVGNYLTTLGRPPEDDLRMLSDLRMPVRGALFGDVTAHARSRRRALSGLRSSRWRNAAGCGRDLDPPRFCAQCGRRLRVLVGPVGYEARCRDHGLITA